MASTPKKRGGWLRKLLFVAAGLVVVLIVAYFVVTSGGFFKGVILPKVGAAMNSEVTVSDASLSPFSQVVLKDLKVTPNGKDTLLSAAEVRLRYSLRAILGGNIRVDEVTVTAPTVSLVTAPDGSSNLDPILAAQKAKPAQPAPPPGPSKPPQIDIKKVAINNGTVRVVKNYAGGKRDLTEVTGLNLALDDLKNGGAAKLNGNADIKLDQNPPAPGTNASLAAKFTADATVELTADLQPKSAKAKMNVAVVNAGGALADAASLAVTLDSELTPSEIRQLALRLQKAGANLAALTVSGPFDATKQEGKLAVALSGIDKQVLNLAGAQFGANFNDTAISSTNLVELAQGGKLITINGQLLAGKFSVTQKGQTTPVLDLGAVYDLTVDQAKSNALIRAFTLNGLQGQKNLLRGALAKPMAVNWGGVGGAVDESALDLAINGLNLADWRAFAADFAPAGTLDAKLNVLSQQAGKKLKLDLTGQLADFGARVASNTIAGADVALTLRADVDDLHKVSLTTMEARIAHQKQPALNIAGSGTLDSKTQDTDLQTTLEVLLPRVAALLGNPNLKVAAGSLKFAGRIAQQNKTPNQASNPAFDRNLTGKVQLEGFTGQYADYRFDRFEAAADCDVALKDQVAEIRKLAASLRQAGQPGGTLDVTGAWDMAKTNGAFNLKVADLNQNTLRSFLSSALGDKKLASISINANAGAKCAAGGEASVKTELSVTNFVVNDPSGQIPARPLDVNAALEAAFAKQVLDLRQCQLALAPTPRAKNQVQLAGKVDMTRSNAITGNLKLTAESLDVTPYYDLFADQSKPAAGKPSPTTSPTSPAPAGGPEKEPDPVTMPLKDFIVDVNIGRFYLREIEITNWVATTKLDSNRVVLNPCQLALNGAPVKAAADVDVGVPGYRYDLSLTADRIPVEPLANSFSPKYRGQAKGDLIANLQIKGAGTTGPNLQKNLAGETFFSFTNANIRIAEGGILKPTLTVIGLALRVPELTQSPLSWLAARATMGGGKISVTSCDLVSESFTASTVGDIALASVLTNSIIQDWPVNLSLRRSLAQKANLVPANAPTNTPYVGLPVFARVRGTVGARQTYIDKLAVAGITAKAITGIPGVGDSKAGSLIQNIGGLLTGDRAANTNQPPAGQSVTNRSGTNQPATNAPASPLNVLDLFKRPKK